MPHSLSIGLSLRVTGQGMDQTIDLMDDTLTLPPDEDLAIGWMEKLFGAPSFTADASATEAGNTVAYQYKCGPFNGSGIVPYTIPPVVAGFVSKLEAAGYSAQLILAGKLN